MNIQTQRPQADLSVWDLGHLQSHLQFAVDLEFFTIPYYMAALYSIKDRNAEAFKLIQSVIRQEMLHATLAANAANAFCVDVKFSVPDYIDKAIPHLDFSLDTPNPTAHYQPYSAELGPLDEQRINTMCLIEYPRWRSGQGMSLRQSTSDYGTIGAFYQSVKFGAKQFKHCVTGSRNQVDIFSNYYRHFPQQTVTENGAAGLTQLLTLIEAIVEQGEGKTEGSAIIPPAFRNTADDVAPAQDHFAKFEQVRNAPALPATYDGVPDPHPGSDGHKAQQLLIDRFGEFCQTLEAVFSGGDAPHFGRQMTELGAFFQNCWRNGAIPKLKS